MVAKSFRVTNGLDAAGEKIINVGKASPTVLSDGVNVEFFNEFNSVNQYDPTRGYAAFMSVIYSRRLWYSRAAIPSPAGEFDETKWFSTRVDPKWEYINVTTSNGLDVTAGQYIVADARFSEHIYNLPSNPIEGDTLVIKDGGGTVAVNSITIRSSTRQMRVRDLSMPAYRITHPYAMITLIYSGMVWRVCEERNILDAQFVRSSASQFQLSAGMNLFRYSGTGEIKLQLPKYANDGDSIKTADLDGMNAINKAVLQVFPGSGHTITVGSTNGLTSTESRTSGHGEFIFDSLDNRWIVYDADNEHRLKRINGDYNLIPGDYIYVTGDTAVTGIDTTLTLPTNVADGDEIEISLYQMVKGQDCTIRVTPSSTDVIRTNKAMLQFPKRSDYPPETTWFTSTSLTFNADDDYMPYLKLSYNASTKEWIVAMHQTIVERVDPQKKSRYGLIRLSTIEQANVDIENNPSKDSAITPETLAQRVALENRRGIARLGTTAEVNQDSTAVYLDDVIVTPKKLNERTATETRRGLAEIATQAEVNAGTDDTVIVTPKKLDTRRASETLAGISQLVTTGASTSEGALRGDAGTNVYNFNENTKTITAKSLNEKTATEKSKGLVVLGTENEVVTGAAGTASMPIVVTPEQLHKKTATESRIGFSEIATQAEVNAGTDDFRFVTPKKFNDRNATETLTGISALATQAEVSTGTNATKAIVPLKLKTYFDVASHVAVAAADGLTQSGTIWNTVNIGILAATETQRGTLRIATQGETNTGTIDNAFLTPAKLHNKKATTTTEGIIRCATNTEAAAGAANNIAITPATMQFLNGTDPAWGATTTRRGAVFITTKESTFIGNDTVGSTEAVDNYQEDYYAVSPRGLNFALVNFLPKNATAQNSLSLGSVIASSWLRRDIAQTVTGALTLQAASVFTGTVTASNTVAVSGVLNLTGDVNSSKTINLNTVPNNVYGISQLFSGASGLRYLRTFRSGATGTIWHESVNGDSYILSTGASNGNFNVLNIGNGSNSTMEYTGRILRVGGKQVIDSQSGVLVFGDSVTTIRMNSGSWDGLTVSNDSGVNTGIVLNTRNFQTHLDSTYVNVSGDTMSGALTAPAFVATNINYPAVSLISTNANIPIEKRALILETNTTGDLNIIFRNPTTSANHSIVTVAAGASGTVYHTGNRPTPADIGAVSLTGSTVMDLIVTNSLKIGNVRITANPITKTCEFTWEP
ncbi:long tail fiber proximal subunit [Pectobacterium phage POP12]|nr:long tail fiber proximal subunit [Pectobacterium phage POP12]